MKSLTTFWAELKRRKVIRAMVVYALVAWLVMQVADVGVPALQLPDWVLTLIALLLILGIPVAIVLAWAYDLKPTGVELTPRLENLQAGDAGGGRDAGRADRVPAPDPTLPAVAVLPFTNLTPASQYGFLADAMAMELHNALSQVDRIRVASRHAALATSGANQTTADIASALSVQYVISGSVGQVGDRIRVFAQLDDAERNTLLWSETFDVDAGQVLETQRRIAESIVSAFGGERLRAEISRAQQDLPNSLGAWGLVQKARGYLLDYGPDTVGRAIELLEQALEIDSDYAVARATLGLVIAERTVSAMSDDPDGDRARAAALVEEAEAQLPRSSSVLRSAGCVRAYVGDYARSERLLRRAVELAPYDLGAWGYLGWPLAARGSDESLREALDILDRLLGAAPRHPGQAYWRYHRAVVMALTGRREPALDDARRATSAQPRFALAWMHMANVLGQLGRAAEARETVSQCARIAPAMTPAYYLRLMSVFSDQQHVIDARVGGLRSAGLLGPA